MWRKFKAFLLGVWEFRLTYTWADPARTGENWYTELDEAYDRGRNLAHVVTLLRFEED